MRVRRATSAALLAAMLWAIHGCGGGGGSNAPAVPPNASTTATGSEPFSVVAAAQTALGLPLSLRTTLGAQVASDSVRWDFGDGNSSDHPAPLHAWWKPGEYRVSVTLKDIAGNSLAATHRVLVAEATGQPASVCNGPNQTGWCTLPPLRVSHGHPLLSWQFIDAQRGWAVAATAPLAVQADPSHRYLPALMPGRELQRTTDGGRTWTPLFADPAARWTQVVMVNAAVGYLHSQAADDAAATLLRTEDGGQSWQAMPLPPAVAIRGLFVAGERNLHLYVRPRPPATALFHRSSDGGRSWIESSPIESARNTRNALWSCTTGRLLTQRADGTALEPAAGAPACNPELHGDGRLIAFFVAGSASEMRYSEDEGGTWTPVVLGARPGGVRPPSRLALHAGGKAWGWDGVAGKPERGVSSLELFRSIDHGRSWQAVALPPLLGNAAVSVIDLDGDTALLHDAHRSYLSLDGGQSWRPIGVPRSWLEAWPTVRRDAGGALQLGAFRSTDEGQSWIDLPALREVAWPELPLFLDREQGVGLYASGGAAVTADGGRSWQPVATGHRAIVDDETPTALALQRDGSGNVWALTRGALLRSADRGHSWTHVPLPAAMQRKLNMLAVAPNGELWVGTALCARRGPQGSEGCNFLTQTLHRSTDQGASWSVVGGVEFGSIASLSVPESGVALVLSTEGTLRRFSEGGAQWQDRLLGRGVIQFVDSRHGWHFDSAAFFLKRSTDGGRTWQELPGLPGAGLPSDQNPWVVWPPLFTSATNGFMVALDGGVSGTSDGGMTWTGRRAAPGPGPLVAFDEEVLWVGGAMPARTINGGR